MKKILLPDLKFEKTKLKSKIPVIISHENGPLGRVTLLCVLLFIFLGMYNGGNTDGYGGGIQSHGGSRYSPYGNNAAQNHLQAKDMVSFSIPQMSTEPRVSAREFFDHNFREPIGNREIFCMHLKILIAHNI